MNAALWVAAVLGAALLVVAGAPKLSGAAKVPLVPAWMARPLGAVEIAIGVWVLVDPSQFSLGVMAVMYALLVMSLIVAIVRQVPDCGCFGVEPVKPSITHLVLDIGLAVCAATAAIAVPASQLGSTVAMEQILTVALALLAAAMLAELMTTGAELRTIRAALRRQR